MGNTESDWKGNRRSEEREHEEEGSGEESKGGAKK